jgi:ubiquinone/menaquinone biosynthesis C-methylase UbiE
MAREKLKGNFIVGNMNKLPYKKDTFDFVASTYALQSSNDVTKAINEMIRVAKKGAGILIVTKHPFRNLLEGHINDKKLNYFKQSKVTSYIFNREIKLIEPSHTMMDYLHPSILKNANLEILEEHNDYPLSEQVMKGLIYPTYMILRFRKK